MQRTAHGRAMWPGLRRAVVATLAGGLLAGGVAACGGSSRVSTTAPPTATTSSATTSANDGLATTGTATSPQVSRKLRSEEAAIHRRVEASLHRASSSHARYGGLPRDLRGRQRAPANTILYSRPGHAADAIQGVPIHVQLPDGATALVTAVGPYIPDADQGSFRNHTNATWEITFTDVHGRVPIAHRVLTITDELGQVLSPRLTARGGGRVPAVVPHGRSFTLVLHARTSIGDGKVRYSPVGGQLLAEWDFDAETD